ncbi:hypothetical protein AVEN_211892-1 [Araneus ventricosus]|uniref:Uncharacterized protein n=1 Tax=Araneus ventricosus TaxID=182803 RepID=A0A4Y2F1F8_ARAVE|nr:hypothetical protein AVEN_211892-1 [Araneus ventricosus]
MDMGNVLYECNIWYTRRVVILKGHHTPSPTIIAPAPPAAAVDCKPIHPLQVKPSSPTAPAPGARFWQ